MSRLSLQHAGETVRQWFGARLQTEVELRVTYVGLPSMHITERDCQEVWVHIGEFRNVRRNFSRCVVFDFIIQLRYQQMDRCACAAAAAAHDERDSCCPEELVAITRKCCGGMVLLLQGCGCSLAVKCLCAPV